MKTKILNTISKLPNSLTSYLANLNQHPEMVFGNQYKNYKDSIKGKTSEDVLANRLLVVVNHAIERVPFYKKKYGDVKVESIEHLKAILGFIDKDIVMQNPEDFKSMDFTESSYDTVTTGGTSGKPLQLSVPKNRYIVELATVHDAWSRVGYDFDLRAVLRNHKLPINKVCQINPITKEIQFDNFRLTEQYMYGIYYSLKKYKVSFFHAYPSAAYQFATFCFNNKLDLSFLKAFLSSSENIHPHQLDFIREQSQTRLFGFYGHSEKLLFGAFCEYTDYFHMEPTYGYFELIDEEGNDVTTPGEYGEMVGTTLNNFGMPLIRYRTGDYAEYLGESCPQCGRKVKVLKKIMGRWNGDKIYNQDGTYTTATALNLHSDLYSVINGLQYYQRQKGELDVLVIKGVDFNETHASLLYKDICSKLSENTIVTVKYVTEMKHNKNGKFLLLKSDVV